MQTVLEVTLHDGIILTTIRVELGEKKAAFVFQRDSFPEFQFSLPLFKLTKVLRKLRQAEDDEPVVLTDLTHRQQIKFNVNMAIPKDLKKNERYILHLTLPVPGRSRDRYTFRFSFPEFWRDLGMKIITFANQVREKDLPVVDE